MQRADLKAFENVPFLFWIKDKEGTYIWANRVACQFAKEDDIVGKADDDLVWADNAAALQELDRQVIDSGKPRFLHEYVDKSDRGKATLNVCKWVDELDGKKYCFGISFNIA